MTDTITCSSCGASAPQGASFCTSCGSRVGTEREPLTDAGSSVASSTNEPQLSDETTRIETPGLHDRTQVLPDAPPAMPPAAAPPAQAPPTAGPSEMPAWSAPPPPGEQGWVAPPTETTPPAWNQPSPPPDWRRQAASPPEWGQAPPPQWGAPVGSSAPGPWAPPRAPARTRDASRSWVLSALLAFLGAVLLVAGVFTPWFEETGQATNQAYPSRTGWELVAKKSSELSPFKTTPDPAILLAIGVAAIVVGGLLISGKVPALMRVLLAAAGVGAAVVLVRDYLGIKDTVKKFFDSGTKFTYQYGFWLCAAAAVLLIIAAVVPSRSRR